MYINGFYDMTDCDGRTIELKTNGKISEQKKKYQPNEQNRNTMYIYKRENVHNLCKL